MAQRNIKPVGLRALPIAAVFGISLVPFFLKYEITAAYAGSYFAKGQSPTIIEPTVNWRPWQEGRPDDGSDQAAGVDNPSRYRVGTYWQWDFDCQITEVEEAGTGQRFFSYGHHTDVHELRVALAASLPAAAITAFLVGLWMLARAAWTRVGPRPQNGFDVLPATSIDRNDPAAIALPAAIRGPDYDRPE